jgi:hypothetical protein
MSIHHSNTLRCLYEKEERPVAYSHVQRRPKLSRVANAPKTLPCFGNEKGKAFFRSSYQKARSSRLVCAEQNRHHA